MEIILIFLVADPERDNNVWLHHRLIIEYLLHNKLYTVDVKSNYVDLWSTNFFQTSTSISLASSLVLPHTINTCHFLGIWSTANQWSYLPRTLFLADMKTRWSPVLFRLYDFSFIVMTSVTSYSTLIQCAKEIPSSVYLINY